MVASYTSDADALHAPGSAHNVDRRVKEEQVRGRPVHSAHVAPFFSTDPPTTEDACADGMFSDPYLLPSFLVASLRR
mgnify:CR=1 FL=1